MSTAAILLRRYAAYLASKKGGQTLPYDSKRVAHDQVLKTALENPGLQDAIRIAEACIRPVATGAGAVAVYLTQLHDKARAAEFWDVVKTGITNDAQNPARQLRERLFADALAKAKLPSDEKFALMLKGWLQFRAGTRTANLRFRTGANGEDFPRVPVSIL